MKVDKNISSVNYTKKQNKKNVLTNNKSFLHLFLTTFSPISILLFVIQTIIISARLFILFIIKSILMHN